MPDGQSGIFVLRHLLNQKSKSKIGALYEKLKNWHSCTGKKYLPPTTTTNGVKTSRTGNAMP